MTIAAPMLLAGVLIVGSLWMLPENCYLVEFRNVALMCHTIDLNTPPEPCPLCGDNQTRQIAQIIFGLGIVIFFLPLVIGGLKVPRERLTKEDSGLELKL